jgi:hypothetical protein
MNLTDNYASRNCLDLASVKENPEVEVRLETFFGEASVLSHKVDGDTVSLRGCC